MKGHQTQAMRNHAQSLEHLTQRGGLSPVELLAVVTDQDYRDVQDVDPDEAVTRLMRLGGLRR